MKLKVDYIPTAELIPYARNARTHSDEQVGQITASIAEFGFVNPVLVGEDNVIIAGHGRLLAASRLGMETVPVIKLGHLSETQRRALVIADNRLAEAAGWDEEMLAIELQALMDDEFDVDITGFDADEIDNLLAGLEDDSTGNTDDDAVPEIEDDPVSKPGDLWILGDHRLLCGDATRLDHVEQVLDGALADMCFTDPPY
ncbi:MAG TPA: site-specific DNA-methyltransferase, partial [Rhizobiales bacterium]|nr:site-specific DNA-methyltransferase [Hyphomicrobiales bacterium]